MWCEALQFQEECPPAAPLWTTSECLMNGGVAVPKRAHAPGNAPSEAGQQEADADPGTQRDNKSGSGRRERRGPAQENLVANGADRTEGAQPPLQTRSQSDRGSPEVQRTPGSP
jgi:hypothetical protein